MTFPRMRPVEAVPLRQEDGVYILLRDPEELAEGEMVVTPGAYLMMTLLDGTRDEAGVQAALLEQTGQVVPQETIRAFLEELDRALLLENGRAAERREAIGREFAALSARPAAHAGGSYPDHPVRLRRAMEELFSSALTPAPATPPAGTNPPRGLVVPHIDIRCGGACMARGFHALRRSGTGLPKRYVILGVAHHWTPGLFTLTEKDFETPLGTVRTDREMTGRLVELYGPHLLDGEIAHKREHSVEFATVFLKHLHEGRDDFTIVPLLCGSLHEEMEEAGRRPIERQDVGGFCRALSTVVAEFGPSVCIIASVDLSHVGLKFGDAEGVDALRAQRIRLADRAMLERVEARDPEGFFDHFRSDRNGRNVDAVTAVYTLLHTLGDGPAELIDYDQFLEIPTQSLVSFASLALY